MIAAFSFLLIVFSLSGNNPLCRRDRGATPVESHETHAGRAHTANADLHEITGLDRLKRYQRAGQDDLAGLQGNAEAAQGVG